MNLSWNRNGNPYSVSFVVESSADGTNWSTAAYTGKRTAMLEGYAPGVKTYFRVRATHRNVASLPSNTFAIYDTGESVELQIAA